LKIEIFGRMEDDPLELAMRNEEITFEEAMRTVLAMADAARSKKVHYYAHREKS
jgi:hypothetical protein